MKLQINQIPSFNYTKKIDNLIDSIKLISKELQSVKAVPSAVRLRKVSKIRSVNSTLAIEGNGLSYLDVRDTINGKTVEGPFDEVLEVKNASKAYDEIASVDVFSQDDFLRIEGIMMWALVEKNGFRTDSVCIAEGDRISYVAPPADEVPEMMGRLFSWCRESGYPMPVVASVFHFYIESIHPFRDGNGRMGRYWHAAMLSRSDRVFRMVSLESAVRKNRSRYYDVLEECQKDMDCTPFVEFMLELTLGSLEELRLLLDPRISAMLKRMGDAPMKASEIMRKMGLSDRNNFRRLYLDPALKCGLAEMTEPDKPRSRNQMYRRAFRYRMPADHIIFTVFAGTPAATALLSTFFVTTAPAAIMAPSPISIPGSRVAWSPIQTFLPMRTGPKVIDPLSSGSGKWLMVAMDT